jgi:hypothetical protein
MVFGSSRTSRLAGQDLGYPIDLDPSLLLSLRRGVGGDVGGKEEREGGGSTREMNES